MVPKSWELRKYLMKSVVGVTGFEPATPTSRIQTSASRGFHGVNKNNKIANISSRDRQLNLLTSGSKLTPNLTPRMVETDTYGSTDRYRT